MRIPINQAQRVVIKVGSSSLAAPDEGLNLSRITELADVVSQLHAADKRVVLVTSGAIAAAMRPLNITRRPRDLETQQAAAAVGQSILMRHYAEAFAAHGLLVAQVLLTVDDVVQPRTYRNVLNTISRLFRLGVVPIINENDTTATHEIRFGDNDRLSALVAHLVRADALFLLTDVDGVYTAHPSEPGSQFLDVVPNVRRLDVDTSRVGSSVGTGGMRSKLEAVSIAAQAGVHVVLGHADHVKSLVGGEDVGTHFLPVGKRRRRRLLWLAHAAHVEHALRIDQGAVDALNERNASLLCAGVTGVDGEFSAGEPVDIVGPSGDRVARGFTACGSSEIVHQEVSTVVHRDSLILL